MATRTTPAKRTRRATASSAAKAAPAKRPAAARKSAAPAEAPAGKPEKRKLVRDSFTIPADEYDLIGQLKKRAIALGREAKKSELLRAGLQALQAMADRALAAALAALPQVKTGRPKARKAAEAKKPEKSAKAAKPEKTAKARKPAKPAKSAKPAKPRTTAGGTPAAA